MRYDPYGHKSVHCDLIVALTEQTEPNYWISPVPIARRPLPIAHGSVTHPYSFPGLPTRTNPLIRGR